MGTYSADLVLRTNQVFHDVEGAAYAHRHPEIFREEGARWRRMTEQYLVGSAGSLRILDVGSGTGFVPSVVAPLLKVEDTMTCSDVSEGMLAVCRENVERLEAPCTFRFQHLDGSGLPFPAESFDAVTMNSVVHHVPLLEEFFAETGRVLKPGGRIFIGHEPNRSYYRSPRLLRWSSFCETVFRPRVAALKLVKLVGLDAVLRFLGIRQALRRLYVKSQVSLDAHQTVLRKVNDRLLREGTIQEPLTPEQITEIVDIHSPTAGETVDPERGFDADEIIAEYLPHFEVEELETYNHLGDVSTRNAVTRRLDARLRRRYPTYGSTLFVVLRKLRAE